METNKNESNSYLSFQLGTELFAAHVSKTESIIEVPEITKIPQSPDYLKGIINIRGKAMPVIDTRIKFGMSPIEMSVNTCILVLEVKVESEALQVGVLVDSVHEVLEINQNEILPPPGLGAKYKSLFIYGVVKYKERFIMLIDMDLVFNADDLEQLSNQVEEINEELV